MAGLTACLSIGLVLEFLVFLYNSPVKPHQSLITRQSTDKGGAMQCSTVQCLGSAVHSSAVQCRIVSDIAVLCSVV